MGSRIITITVGTIVFVWEANLMMQLGYRALIAQASVLFLAYFSLGQNPELSQPMPNATPYDLDADRLHFAHVEWATPLRHEEQNRSEFETYNDILIHARQFPTQELVNAGRTDLSVLDLLNRHVGRDYQYKLIRLDGRLLRARRLELNKPLSEAGIQTLFECWVFPLNRSEPVCFVGTDFPSDLEPAMIYEPSKRVSLAGYYLKPIAYESAAASPKDMRKNKIEVAPLLLGHGLILRPDPVSDMSQPWREGFLPGLSLVLGSIAVVALSLTVYFRRGDRVTRESLRTRAQRNPFDQADSGSI